MLRLSTFWSNVVMLTLVASAVGLCECVSVHTVHK